MLLERRQIIGPYALRSRVGFSKNARSWQRGEDAPSAEGQTQQVGVGHLLVPHQPSARERNCIGEWRLVRPEGMVL